MGTADSWLPIYFKSTLGSNYWVFICSSETGKNDLLVAANDRDCLFVMANTEMNQ